MECVMEFESVIGFNTFLLIDASMLHHLEAKQRITYDALCAIINKLGAKSAEAQQLKTPITTSKKLQISDHKLYLAYSKTTALGFIKTGRKTLYITDFKRPLIEKDALCVLDFYVDESVQRHGWGKRLFDYMLKVEGADPKLLAYDRPSEKLVPFLKRHYQLTNGLMQTNRFLVFAHMFHALKNENDSGRQQMANDRETRKQLLS